MLIKCLRGESDYQTIRGNQEVMFSCSLKEDVLVFYCRCNKLCKRHGLNNANVLSYHFIVVV